MPCYEAQLLVLESYKQHRIEHRRIILTDPIHLVLRAEMGSCHAMRCHAMPCHAIGAIVYARLTRPCQTGGRKG